MRSRAILYVVCIAVVIMIGFKVISQLMLMPNHPSHAVPAVQDKIRHSGFDVYGKTNIAKLLNIGSHDNLSPVSSMKDNRCPDILAGMTKGQWLTRPLTDFEQMSMDVYLQVKLIPTKLLPF